MLSKPAIFPGPASQARLAGRLGLSAFIVLVVVGIVTRGGQDPVQTAVGAGLAVAAAVPLFLIRPRLGLGLAAVATAGVVVLGNADSRAIVWFALVIVVGWCVLSGGVWIGIAYWIGAMLLFGAEWLWAIRDPGWAPWAAGVTISVLATVLIRHEFVLVERLRAAQADLAARTRAEERTRIARELHDVIAHSLTVALLHVTGARLAVEHDPADASRALAEAERLGRQSLAEVRATMGLPAGDAVRGHAPRGGPARARLRRYPGPHRPAPMRRRGRLSGRKRRPRCATRDGRSDRVSHRPRGPDQRNQTRPRLARRRDRRSSRQRHRGVRGQRRDARGWVGDGFEQHG